jgi:hypothetical protein
MVPDRADEAVHLLRVGDVDRDCERLAAICVDALGELVDLFRAPCTERDLRARLGAGERGRRPDA